ncbi:hypothetical protein QL285_075001 [Trifolium repens]|nr:hypothetical protein QL285_075001 [Trifolium repens]
MPKLNAGDRGDRVMTGEDTISLADIGREREKKSYGALATHNKLQPAKKQKKVDWFSHKSKASYECGYFIMIHMLNIVYTTLVGSSTQIFGDSKLFQKDEVKNVQECCANMILEHIEASIDNDM